MPDWGKAANSALEYFFPQIVVFLLLLHVQRLIPLARSSGFDILISRCKIRVYGMCFLKEGYSSPYKIMEVGKIKDCRVFKTQKINKNTD